MRRALALLALAALAVVPAACGDDGGGATASFCDQLRGLQADDALGGDLTDAQVAEAAVQQLDDLAEAAPAEVRDDVETLRDVIRLLADTDPSDPDAFAAAFTAILDPQVQQASDDLAVYASEECGIELDTGVSSDAGDTGTGTTGTTDADTTTTTAASTTSTEPPESLDTSAVLDHFETSYSGAPWFGAVTGVGLIGGTELYVDTDLATADESIPAGLEICEATAEIAYSDANPRADETTIEVNDANGNVLAERQGPDASCTQASG
ncbi:MAG: hypothetical protein IPM45_15470 [Acidimicrobiales bacterium]|nr:hypothetical protein [Acidimicrobiales bacterium]